MFRFIACGATRKTKRYVFALTLMFLWPHISHAQFAGGDGSIDDPYEVATAEQLDDVRNNLTSHFVQVANIDLEGYGHFLNGWTPIPNFEGHYNGQNFTISNLEIDNVNQTQAGLFGSLEDVAVVVEVVLENVSITSNQISGAIAGDNRGAIRNCTASGEVNVQGTGTSSMAGGIAGINSGSGSIEGCEASVTVSANASTVGGLVGFNWGGLILQSSAFGGVTGDNIVGGLVGNNQGRIEACHAMGGVTAEGTSSNQGAFAGGLVGLNSNEQAVIVNSYTLGAVTGERMLGGIAGRNGNGATIRTSFSVGNVIGNTSNIGGLVGDNPSGIIEDCYTKSSVQGGNFTGGFVGNNEDNFGNNGTIINCYAMGFFSASGEEIGGFSGRASEGITHCFWNIQTSDILTSPLAERKTTTQLQQMATFTAIDTPWDFDDVWGMNMSNNNGTPFLRWQEGLEHNPHGDDTPALVLSDYLVELSTGETFTYTIRLNTIPSEPITLTVSTPGCATIDGENATLLTFQPDASALEPQEVTLTAEAVTELSLCVVRHQVTEGTYPILTENEMGVIIDPNMFSGGDGTPDNPYLVATPAQLHAVRNELTAYYRQIADIDLDAENEASPYWNDGLGWLPIGSQFDPFTGGYDGDEYTIEGLYINRPNLVRVGLFGNTGGPTLTNIRLVDVDVTGDFATGGLVGHVLSGPTLFQNCVVTGRITGNGNTGGMAGNLRLGSTEVANCTADVIVTGTNSATGGLIGQFSGDIEDCSSAGSVTGDGQVGGLIGVKNSGGTFTDCSSSANVTNEGALTGGLVGEIIENGGELINCSATGTVEGNNTTGGLIGRNSSANVNFGAVLISCFAEGNVSGTDHVGGLVGRQENGGFETCYTLGNVTANGDYVGGLAGYALNADIEESYATGQVENQGNYTGGLVGWSERSTIQQSYATGMVQGADAVGGIIGQAEGTETLSNSFARGDVIGETNVGGIVGISDQPMINSYATGAVIGDGNAGGLIGDNRNSITYSYWDTLTTTLSVGVGVGGNEGAIASSTSPMTFPYDTSIYRDWNFETIWGINPDENDGYPFLRWQGFEHQEEPRMVFSQDTLQSIGTESVTYTVQLGSVPSEVVDIEVSSTCAFIDEQESVTLTFQPDETALESQELSVSAIDIGETGIQDCQIIHEVLSEDLAYDTLSVRSLLLRTDFPDCAEAEILTSEGVFEYCEGDEGITLESVEVSSETNYTWEGPVTGNEQLLENATLGVYSLIIEQPGCASDTITAEVIQLPLPQAEIVTSGDGLRYTEGTAGVTLEASDAGAEAVYEWFGPVTGTGVTLENATAGSYTITVELNGCVSTSDPVEVIEEELVLPGIDLSHLDVSLNTASGGNYSLSIKTIPEDDVTVEAITDCDVLINGDEKVSAVTFLTDSTALTAKDFVIEVAPSSGRSGIQECIIRHEITTEDEAYADLEIDDVQLRINWGESEEQLPPIVIYNALSPNGDGSNESLFIENIEYYENNRVAVFTRWGDLVVRVDHYDNLSNAWTPDDSVLDGEYFVVVTLGATTDNETSYLMIKR